MLRAACRRALLQPLQHSYRILALPSPCSGYDGFFDQKWQPYNDCTSRFYRAGRGPPRNFPPGSLDEHGEPQKRKGFFGMDVQGFDIDPNDDDRRDADDDFFSRRRRQDQGGEMGDGDGRPTVLSPEERLKERTRRRRERFYKQFKMVVVDVNRTFKVTKGGGKISFTALAICGNGEGVAGFGKGKGKKASAAVKKACRKALTNLHCFERYKEHTIYHYVEAKYGKTKVRLWPEWSTGLFRAGNIIASILKLAGFKTIKSKLIGNAHPHNTVKATFLALSKVQTPQEIREKFWRPVVEQHLVVDADGKPDPHVKKYNPWVLI